MGKSGTKLIKCFFVMEERRCFENISVNQVCNLQNIAKYIYHIRSCDFTCHLCRCNRLKCPLARMSGLQCFNMGHNGHGINLYGVSMTLMEN